jgi:hypothetical protein
MSARKNVLASAYKEKKTTVTKQIQGKCAEFPETSEIISESSYVSKISEAIASARAKLFEAGICSFP